MPPSRLSGAAIATALTCCLLAGCAQWRVPQIDPSGRRIFLPAESRVATGVPPVAGLPVPQETITLTPREIVAPVGSEVVLLAGVLRPDGQLRSQQRIEWMLDPQSAGQFITLGKNWFDGILPTQQPRKVDNNYVVSRSVYSTVNITRGTADPSDDITVRPGQAWISLSSPHEGISRVTAFAPDVPGWRHRKATSTIHWVDVQWSFPPPAINPVGQRHIFTSSVSRQTNSAALPGMIVRYEITGGVPAAFGPDGEQIIEVVTNELGQASAEVFQPDPQAGTCEIGIQIIRPAQPDGTRRLVLGSGTTNKTWTSPDIAVRTTGPAVATVGATAQYRIEVSNPGNLPVEAVSLEQAIPPGLSLVGSNPAADTAGDRLSWQVGQLGPQESRTIEVEFLVQQTGTLEVCAEALAAGGLAARSCTTTNVTQPQANVELRVSGPDQAVVGSTARFEIVIANRGNATATGLVLSDSFGAGLQHIVAESPIEQDVPDLAPGQSRRIYITFRVVEAGRLCHTVRLTGDGPIEQSQEVCLDSTEAASAPSEAPRPARIHPDDQPAARDLQPPSSAESPQPTTPRQPPAGVARLSVQKRGPAQKEVGETAEFLIRITNTGEVPATNLEIADRYDLALNPIEASEGFRPFVDRLVWQVERLEPGKSLTLKIRCRCQKATSECCNRVTVTADQVKPQAGDACLTVLPASEQPAENHSTPTPPPAESTLRIKVTDLNDPVRQGAEAAYRIFVTNEGSRPAADVRLTVWLPEQLRVVEIAAQVKHELTDGRLTFQPHPQLKAGQTAVYTIKTEATAAGKIQLEAAVVAAGSKQPIEGSVQTEILP